MEGMGTADEFDDIGFEWFGADGTVCLGHEVRWHDAMGKELVARSQTEHLSGCGVLRLVWRSHGGGVCGSGCCSDCVL